MTNTLSLARSVWGIAPDLPRVSLTISGVCLALVMVARLQAADLSVVTLFDAERDELVNNWGGAWGTGNMRDVRLESQWVHSGRRALCCELGPTRAGELRYTQCLASGFGRTAGHRQVRDLARFQRMTFAVLNRTSVPLRGMLQIKDYRDSLAHRAVYRFALPAGERWTVVDLPLKPSAVGWEVEGHPDLAQVVTIDFGFAPGSDLEAGCVCLDDLTLTEPGGPLDVATSPLERLVDRLVRRQWDALWAARSRSSGLIPNNSYQSSDAGLNTTAAVLWMLPAAVDHAWVSHEHADGYVRLVAETFQGLLDRSLYLPPRNVDWVTLQPSLLPEESSVDAAFLALALHQYQSLPATSAELRQVIERVQNRLDFAAFARPAGWRMAYRYATRSHAAGFVEGTYDGYTNEANIISLAAHLAGSHRIPIETHWNSNTHRLRTHLAGVERSPVVHAEKEFRAPFAQALLNLFVDVRQRGIDIYPDHGLATNPWQNFVLYEQSVMARLEMLGRSGLVQPDAGDDGTLTNYQQFSLYEDFGQNDLFMPWSAAFPLLADAPGADAALRFLLQHGLYGPLGLADAAHWKTGQTEPSRVTSRHDFWNTALATMALLEWLDGDRRLSRSFANLPEVRLALDRVFWPEPVAAGSVITAAARHESPIAKPTVAQGASVSTSGGPATVILVGRSGFGGAAKEANSD
jgi:hypothetical protein